MDISFVAFACCTLVDIFLLLLLCWRVLWLVLQIYFVKPFISSTAKVRVRLMNLLNRLECKVAYTSTSVTLQ